MTRSHICMRNKWVLLFKNIRLIRLQSTTHFDTYKAFLHTSLHYILSIEFCEEWHYFLWEGLSPRLLLVNGLLYPLAVVGHFSVDAVLALVAASLPKAGYPVHCPSESKSNIKLDLQSVGISLGRNLEKIHDHKIQHKFHIHQCQAQNTFEIWPILNFT